MKVEVDLTEYGVKAPKWYDPINPHVINASGGSGGGNDVELTWEEYEALSEEEKMNGSNYFITDIGNPKSLVKKVLAFKERPFSFNTEYSFLLSESFLNFDYISVELKNGNSLRSIITFPTQSYPTGTIEMYIAAGVSSNFNGRADLVISNGVNASYQIYENNGNLLTQYTDILVTGYRYERVIVPNQMVNYSTVEARIGTWIDGKPLYQKTITKTNVPELTSGYGYLLTWAESEEIGIDHIYDLEGSYIDGFPLNCFIENNNAYAAAWFGKVIYYRYKLWGGTNKTAVFTIKYTKTTD